MEHNFELNDNKIKDAISAMISAKNECLRQFGWAIEYAVVTDLFFKVAGTKNSIAHRGIMNIDGKGCKEWIIKQQFSDDNSVISITDEGQTVTQTLSLCNRQAKFVISSPFCDEETVFRFRVQKLPIVGPYISDIKESIVLKEREL